jgi:hypothetical protein
LDSVIDAISGFNDVLREHLVDYLGIQNFVFSIEPLVLILCRT